MKLELVLVPVTDVDRVKAFYTAKAGFNLDVDHSAGDEFRVVQMTPPGSACSISIGIGITDAVPGSVRGLHLVVSDIVAARDELVERGAGRQRDLPLRAERTSAGPASGARGLRLVRRLQRSRRQHLGVAGGQAQRAEGVTGPAGAAIGRWCASRVQRSELADPPL
jgi:catechol 2,3-dioxygenase-like lactoylglutathione lyase family enzyme